MYTQKIGVWVKGKLNVIRNVDYLRDLIEKDKEEISDIDDIDFSDEKEFNNLF